MKDKSASGQGSKLPLVPCCNGCTFVDKNSKLEHPESSGHAPDSLLQIMCGLWGQVGKVNGKGDWASFTSQVLVAASSPSWTAWF